MRDSGGYGHLSRQGKRLLAHRWTWEQAHGPIPEGLWVCHTCDNPPCINLDHLWLGTPTQNTADARQKGRLRGNTSGPYRQRKGIPMKTRTIQFDEGVYSELTTAASERGVSINWMVNKLCEEGLNRLEPDLRVTT